jgi:hypothetical protein
VSRRGPGALLATLLFGVALAAGCSTGHHKCTVSKQSTPRCGVLWGIATEPNTTPKLHAVERSLGMRFDVVYRFHDLDDEVPTAEESGLVASGRILHIAIDSRIFQPPARTVPWRKVAAGAYDRQLTANARRIAMLGRRVFVTFGHEPDKPTDLPASPAGFVAAWRHVHDLFVRAGARNVVWVWVVTGYPPFFRVAGALWPGNRYVDWISWEAYNRSGCTRAIDRSQFRTFAQAALPFLHWLKDTGVRFGIDIKKPMMISEAATVVYPGDPELTASWYRDIPLVLDRNPEIKAVALWDRPGLGACQFQFDGTAQVMDAVRDAGTSGVVVGRPSSG